MEKTISVKSMDYVVPKNLKDLGITNVVLNNGKDLTLDVLIPKGTSRRFKLKRVKGSDMWTVELLAPGMREDVYKSLDTLAKRLRAAYKKILIKELKEGLRKAELLELLEVAANVKLEDDKVVLGTDELIHVGR